MPAYIEIVKVSGFDSITTAIQDQTTALAQEGADYTSASGNSANLPDGGAVGGVNANSITSIISSSTVNRNYYIANRGTTQVSIFLGQNATFWESDPVSPFVLSPGDILRSENSTSNFEVFAWSEGGAGLVAVALFS